MIEIPKYLTAWGTLKSVGQNLVHHNLSVVDLSGLNPFSATAPAGAMLRQAGKHAVNTVARVITGNPKTTLLKGRTFTLADADIPTQQAFSTWARQQALNIVRKRSGDPNMTIEKYFQQHPDNVIDFSTPGNYNSNSKYAGNLAGAFTGGDGRLQHIVGGGIYRMNKNGIFVYSGGEFNGNGGDVYKGVDNRLKADISLGNVAESVMNHVGWDDESKNGQAGSNNYRYGMNWDGSFMNAGDMDKYSTIQSGQYHITLKQQGGVLNYLQYLNY